MTETERLNRLLQTGNIDRRTFLAGLAALGIGATTLTAPVARAAPKQGGLLRLGLAGGSTTDSLDPATFNDTYMRVVSWALRNNLTEIDNHGKVIGELAESWEPSAAADEWRFKLRRGIEFHSGKLLDATDVVNTINYHIGPESKSGAKALLSEVSGVKADGDDTVVFTLSRGNVDFPAILSAYNLNVLPTKDDKLDWQSGDGTGGYMLDSYNPGVRTTLKRNPNYWKSDRAYFDEAEVLAIADTAARTNALRSNQVDVMNRCGLNTVDLLKKVAGLKVEEVTGARHYTLPMRCDTAPFDNNDVRLALKYAIDREALVKTILRGHGALGNDQPIGPSYRFYADDIPQRQYDPDKAKHHLKKAGMDKLKVQLYTADAAFSGAVDTAVLYRGHAAKADIDIEVVREPDDGYQTKVWMNRPFCMTYWAGRPTADMMFSIEYAAKAPWNDSFWKNERFNQLLDQARAEFDEGKRREMYREMQLIVRDDGGVIIPMFANFVYAMADKVQHDPAVAANYGVDGNKCIERWWFA